MAHTLKYGRSSWSYDDFDTEVPCRPSPLVTFSPVKVNGKIKHPKFSDRIGLSLIQYRTAQQIPFKEAYEAWFREGQLDGDLGEGRGFLRWLHLKKTSLILRPSDYKFHSYFLQEGGPQHQATDEMAQGHSFVIRPVVVENRKVQLYLLDDAVISLLALPFGDEEDFIRLVETYVKGRFRWESWRAPAPPFLEWLRARGQRPVFSKGQLGLSLAK